MKIEIIYDPKKEVVTIGNGTGDSWFDLGILMEALGVMIRIECARGFTNLKGIKTKEALVKHVQDYIAKVGNDYQNVSENIPLKH